MTKKHTVEREGQKEFYETFLPLVDKNLDVKDVLADDNDGVLNGNLLEFKLRVSDLNATLFQCVKYCSARRVKGKPVPANIVIVDLNGEIAYLYHSADYLADIEKVYAGGASKDNAGFMARPYSEKYVLQNQLDAARVVEVLRERNWTKVHIDENCIVGWATSFYREVPGARKEDFLGDDTGKHKTIGEIRRPNVFEAYIYPYTGKSNVRFQYLMDKLNDTLQKKNLGAFYTPEAYARKSHELLRMAIARVPDGNDYIILDRCAGTGNLEKTLTDEELSHCVLSTVEYYEYKVLQELIGDKVRHIIPPVEADDTFNAGLVKGADALSEGYINNPVIRKYVDNPNCTIILFENPPYAETTSVEHQRRGAGKKSSTWKHSYVVQEMKKEIKGTASNDLGNAFIWSGFKYFLRQPTDSYIVYSPVKYWKVHHLIDKKFLGGFAFNRRWFHTNIDACIMVALWANEEAELKELEAEGYEYCDQEDQLDSVGMLAVKRIYTLYSKRYYDKRQFDDDTPSDIYLGYDGTPARQGVKLSLKAVHNDNILGYMVIDGSNFDNPDLMAVLIRAGLYKGHGFYLRKDNYLEKLPMFCASRYITYNRQWTERSRIMKSADGAERFEADVRSGKLDQWLRKCLLFTCLEAQNHMRTFKGNDGRFYRNELCLDTTHGETVASLGLAKLKMNKTEQALVAQWELLLEEAKKTDEYNSSLTYGVYQVFAEIDTCYKDEDDKTVWNNIEVHSALQTLKTQVKEYYNREIAPTLFEYEYLK